jgi:hypothetical protein
MASLFENMPGINVARNVVSNTRRLAPNSGGGMGNYILYGLLIAVVILIYLLLTGYKFSLKSLDIRPQRFKALDDSHLFWKNGDGGVKNLMISADLLPDNMNNKYTYHFDLLLANTRNITNIEGPYRHIFHRGSGELYTDMSGSVTAAGSPRLPPYGLPKRLNPGIFLDPNTNDIIVFVDTMSKTGDVYRESARISDIPVEKPLRLTVNVHNQVLEVDLNCKLETTKVLAGEPKTVENNLYGLCGKAAAEAAIQNLYVWPFSISSEMLSNFCPMPFPPFQPAAKTCGASTDPSLMPSLDTITNRVEDWVNGSK